MSLDIYLEIDNDDDYCFSANITHNLNKMAEAAGLYKHLWRPDEIGITKANEIIEPLKQGLIRLISEPYAYKKLNPSNGWGSYDGLVNVVKDYYVACINYPDATIRVSR